MLGELQWIVVPGGPGLSSSYLKYALEKIHFGCKLYFYDMYGSPESENNNPTLDEMVDQISHVASENKLGEYGLITHSFGNYLAIRAQQKDKNIKAIIMLNPIPFNYQAWKSALTRIVEKVPESALKVIISLSESNDSHAGAQLFRLIFPYYIGVKNIDLPIDVPFDIKACNFIADKVSEYNDEGIISSSEVPMVRIVGELDSFFNDKEFIPDQLIIIPGVGHYPFFEDPENFNNAMKHAGELLCQQKMKMKIKYS